MKSAHCGHNCIELFRRGDLSNLLYTYTHMCMMYICIVYCTNTQACTIFVHNNARPRERDVRVVDETMNGGRHNVVRRSAIEYACLMGYG